jgi:DNA-directed RNA polymerase specialized sigma24 family protein
MHPFKPPDRPIRPIPGGSRPSRIETTAMTIKNSNQDQNPDDDADLSEISTSWPDLRAAHQGPDELMQAARGRLIARYGGAIHRYLRGALHDPEAAQEVYQTFVVRFLRGDFRRVDPGRGRFRSYLKSALFRLVADHRRQVRRQPSTLGPGTPEPAVAWAGVIDDDRAFLASWTAELLERAWVGLAELERDRGRPFFTLLRFRTENPAVRSPAMAERFSAELGRELTPDWVRKCLHQAREHFADLLLDEVAHSLARPTSEDLEAELIDLGWLRFCRTALQRRRNRP